MTSKWEQRKQRLLDTLHTAYHALPSADREQFLLDNSDDLTDDDIMAICADRELLQSGDDNLYNSYDDDF